jgi:hypothetical protein
MKHNRDDLARYMAGTMTLQEFKQRRRRDPKPQRTWFEVLARQAVLDEEGELAYAEQVYQARVQFAKLKEIDND